MNRYLAAASTLSAAVGLALVLQSPVSASDAATKADASKAGKDKLEKCYGINAAGKNDCATGAHSCAGQATDARDPKSYVLLPAGSCIKIAGGSTQAL